MGPIQFPLNIFLLGRSSFFEDETSTWWAVNPQHVLGFLLFITIFASFGFAIVISIRNFKDGRGELPSALNGKYGSIKYGNEKSTIRDQNIEENRKDPQFAVWDEIGRMSDKMIAEKLATEELDQKLKASKINIIEKVETEKQDEGRILSRELLTHHPLAVEQPQEPTEAPDNKLGRGSDRENTDNNLVNNLMQEAVEISKGIESLVDGVESKRMKLETTDIADVPIHVDTQTEGLINYVLSESMETKSDIKSQPNPKNLNLKKTNRVNPLLKDVGSKKMSRARKTAIKIISDGDDDASPDYPDLPTFRGMSNKGEGDDQL